MKTPMLKLSIFIAMLLISKGLLAQTPTPWYLGGQTTAGEVIGTINPQPFTIITNNTPRFYFTTAGSFGLNAASPNYRFQTHETTASTANYIQVGNNTSGSGSADGLLIGLDASGNALLNQQEALPMIFSTSGTEQMRLLATGNLGIGTATPEFLLDVAGNMNLDTFNFYRIGGMEALYIDTALNVGVGMFNEMNTITTGKRNIAVGYLSGSSLTDGFQNTFLGTYAGEDVASASNNAFFGECAGRNTTDNSNTMVGAFSGFTNTGGYNNTFLGFAAAYNIASGNHNLMAGSNAGRDLSTGTNHHNVILGADAGYTSGGAVMTAGTTLTLVGYNTEASNSLTNATAIGANAMVGASNAVVIGSINTVNGASVTANVGIGTTTPDNRLEVVKGTSGASGLRLTSLAGSTAGAPNGEVLTIDSNGDVILVQDACTALVLKAEDSDAYFRITVNAQGELKTTAL